MARTTFQGPVGIGKGTTPTVTQATNRSTGVTLNAASGQITMNSTSLAAGADVSFVVTNNKCTANSVPVVAIKSMATGLPSATVTTVADGSFTITVTNLDGATADTTADVINFIVFNGSNTGA